MGIRSLVLLSFVAAITLTRSARADIPNPTTGSGSSTTSSSSGAGGSTATTSGTGGSNSGGFAGYDPNCTIAQESTAGSTCVECDPTGASCNALDSTYNIVCLSAKNKAVYCDGPNGSKPSDQNVACSVALPGGVPGTFAAFGALAAACALLVRRKRG
jgi:hypothetical protein